MKTCPRCNELLGDSVKVCFNCNYDFVLKRVLDKNEVSKNREDDGFRREQAMQYAETRRLEREKQLERNPKFEYISVVINDLENGTIDNIFLQNTLTEYAETGWRLHSIFTNEVGKTSSSVSVGFLGSNVNATIDQTILIFERCIKPEEK